MRKIALLVVAVAVSLLGVEALLRIFGLAVHELHGSLRLFAAMQVVDDATGNLVAPPGATVRLWGHEHRFNSLGMRDEEPRVPKPAGIFRILLLGDSVTFGQGVPQEAIFAYRLRELLRDRPEIDVVAAGIPGWNTTHQERFLSAYIGSLDPDVVVLLYVGNDREPINPMTVERKRAENLWDASYRFFITHSRVAELVAFTYRARFAKPDLGGIEEFRRWQEHLQTLGEPFAPADPGWRDSRAALERIRTLLRTRGIELYIVTDSLGSVRERGAMLARLNEYSHDTGVPVTDMDAFFGDTPDDELRNAGFIDAHPNAKAHELIGKGILAMLGDWLLQ